VVGNPVLVTTKWSRAHRDEGQTRELELCEEYWKALLHGGAQRERFVNTYESAWKIVDLIPTDRQIDPALLRGKLEDFRARLKNSPFDGILSLLRSLLGRGVSLTYISIVLLFTPISVSHRM
jgi:hypothetical protein